MSARIEDTDQVRAIISGGDDYVIKPFSHELLLAKINSHIWEEIMANMRQT